jgi:hypothetical protein
MTEKSEAFEQLNTRIHKLLAGKSKVTWNSSIPDPDDPTQPRQIDILIEEHGGRRTSVECRDRTGVQSVMWVEELIGRKQSLGLDGMIGVAVNGFTPLAQKKAARYGIILYDFRTLTDAEIASWANAATVRATFVQFKPLEITAGIHHSDAGRLPPPSAPLSFLRFGGDGYAAVMDMIRDDAFAKQGMQHGMSLDPTGFEIDGIPLTLLRATFTGYAVSVAPKCTAVEVVAHPGTPLQLRDISVQRFEHTVSEIIRSKNDVHVALDVSNLKPPPDSILHQMQVEFPASVTVKGYEIIGNKTLLSQGLATALNVATTT